MTMNEILIQALSPVSLPIYPDTYTGQDVEYLVFNFDATPILFGDDKPVYLQYLIQVHLFAAARNRHNRPSGICSKFSVRS